MEKTNKDRIKEKEHHHDCQCPGKDMTKEDLKEHNVLVLVRVNVKSE